MRRAALIFTFVLASALAASAQAVAIGATIPNFALADTEGKAVNLNDVKGKNGTVLIFVATRCPVSNGYNERMNILAKSYSAKGVNVVGVNSNVTEPASEIKAHAAQKGCTCPVLVDKGSAFADKLGANVTPEAYLIDAAGKLVYHGRIDNDRSGERVTDHDLADAIEATLAGKAVAKTELRAFGCSIKRTVE
jgi:peroxiredoxin